MIGIIKKFDPHGFGIIEASDGSKLAFILSDFARDQFPREGQKVIFSIRSVKRRIFASNVDTRGKLSNQCSQQLLAGTIGLYLRTFPKCQKTFATALC
jgi:cold shock CspA family protein